MTDLDVLAHPEVMQYDGERGDTAYAIEQLIPRGPRERIRCARHKVDLGGTYGL
jgi:hypothetical protein